jgi:hypothetical protein
MPSSQHGALVLPNAICAGNVGNGDFFAIKTQVSQGKLFQKVDWPAWRGVHRVNRSAAVAGSPMTHV